MIYGITTLIIACIYCALYCKTRRFCSPFYGKRNACFVRLCVAFGLNCVVYSLCETTPENSRSWLIFLVNVLACIDIFILKIPTEVLPVCSVLVVYQLIEMQQPLFLSASALLFGGVFLLLRKKIGISLYDIWLITLLMMTVSTFGMQIRFTALFLILWGVIGCGLRIKNKRNLISIPLVPEILLSYLFVIRFIQP